MRPDLIVLPRFVFEVALIDPAGRVSKVRTWSNILTTAGKNWYADFARGVTGKTKLVSMAIGSGSAAADVADVLLQAEVTRLALAAAGTDTGDSGVKNLRTAGLVTLQITFGPSITATIREVGLFSDIASPPGAANTGTLVHRAIIGAYGLTGANRLRVRGKYNYT